MIKSLSGNVIFFPPMMGAVRLMILLPRSLERGNKLILIPRALAQIFFGLKPEKGNIF